MRVAGYIRVSTEEQVQEGYSLDAQRERLLSFCNSQDGWELTRIYLEEGKSAKDLNRPELQQMLNDAKDGLYDIVLVYRLDRLTRSVVDLYNLLQTFEQHSIKFKSVTEVYDTTTAMGKLFITIVAALAQWERENLSERVRFGMEQLVREGKWHGGAVPYGYKWENKNMIIIEEEAKILRELRKIYLNGEGLGSTAKKLNTLGLYRRGHTWSAQSVWYSLDNPFYAGKMRYGEKKKNGKYASRKKEELVNVIWSDTGFPTIFTWEEYLEHTSRMKRKEFYGHAKKREYRFSGVLRCARCGYTLLGRPYKNRLKDGTMGIPYYNYICSNRSMQKGCDLPLLKQEVAENLIMEYVKQINFDSNKITQKQMQNQNNDAVDYEKLNKELKKIAERRKKLQNMYLDDLISSKDLRERKKEEDEKEAAIKEKLEAMKLNDESSAQSILQKAFELPDVWYSLSDTEKRELMQTVFKHIYVDCKVKSGKGVAVKGKSLPFYIKEVEVN